VAIDTCEKEPEVSQPSLLVKMKDVIDTQKELFSCFKWSFFTRHGLLGRRFNTLNIKTIIE